MIVAHHCASTTPEITSPLRGIDSLDGAFLTYLVTYTHVTYTLFGFMLKPLAGQQCLAETDLWVSGI